MTRIDNSEQQRWLDIGDVSERLVKMEHRWEEKNNMTRREVGTSTQCSTI